MWEGSNHLAGRLTASTSLAPKPPYRNGKRTRNRRPAVVSHPARTLCAVYELDGSTVSKFAGADNDAFRLLGFRDSGEPKSYAAPYAGRRRLRQFQTFSHDDPP